MVDVDILRDSCLVVGLADGQIAQIAQIAESAELRTSHRARRLRGLAETRWIPLGIGSARLAKEALQSMRWPTKQLTSGPTPLAS